MYSSDTNLIIAYGVIILGAIVIVLVRAIYLWICTSKSPRNGDIPYAGDDGEWSARDGKHTARTPEQIRREIHG